MALRLLRWVWYAILLALIALTALQFWFLAHIWYWADHNPENTAFMRARLAIERQDDPRARLAHQWVPYHRISPHLKRAVIAAEDDKFVDHSGFDWEAMKKAHERNVKEGEIVVGASTVSQQLAKNLFLPSHRTWWRKAQEAAITAMLETVLSKRRILEIYLNVVEWGDGVFGAEAGARHHFGVPAAALTPEQAARLAVMLPSPRSYPPGRDTLYLQSRTATILGRMPYARIP
jgi:monofunctional glycosyltransferase